MSKRLWTKHWYTQARGANIGFAYIGLLWNPSALWIGAHWSKYNRRLCVNVVPCLTLWVTLPGGNQP